MKKILVIGNSFSQDSVYYLHDMAKSDGIELDVYNLYIAGCSLETHAANIKTQSPSYLLEKNGRSLEKHVSVGEALGLENKWDFIITQQASYNSGIFETFHPHLENIVAFLKEKSPEAEILLNQTWSYEPGSSHPEFYRYEYSSEIMYKRLKSAYSKAAEKSALRLIPCGDAVQTVRKSPPFIPGENRISICRDGYHINIIYGRYLLSAIWYKTLFGKSVLNNAFIPASPLAPNENCEPDILKVIKEIVSRI